MNELYHYGIPGQKWGVQRYQHQDGTYTPEGARRHALDEREDYNSSRTRKNVHDINANYYNKKASKLKAKANRNRTMANMNSKAAENGHGVISKMNKLNANYYNKKADKLESKANRNKTMADLNEAASKQRNDAKRAKHEERISKSVKKVGKTKISSANSNKVSVGKAAIDGYKNTKNVYASLNQNPNRYQRAMRKLGASNFARDSIKTSKYLDENGKKRAMAEHKILRAERNINRSRKVVGAAKAVVKRNK